MENLTHSLIGAVLAEATLPATATSRQRTAFYAAGILAANLPDADLLYTSITPPPIGYLLHHRGHTHTVVGLIGLAALIGIVALIPAARRLLVGVESRFRLLIGAALASHLIADSWNSYGVHPFYPIDNRWFYGDAVYILEPWLWTLLGVSVVMNTRDARRGWLLAAVLIGLPVAAAWIGMIGRGTLIPLAIAAAAGALVLRRWKPATRSIASLVAAAVFVALSFGARGVANAAIETSVGSSLDVVLNPRPANPLCWTALRIERRGDDMIVHHGEVAVAPVCGMTERVRWSSETSRQSITVLRELALANCPVRAWLQFGRAPVVARGWIADERYGGTDRGNFSAMRLAEAASASDCPPHLTHWTPPRSDVLTR